MINCIQHRPRWNSIAAGFASLGTRLSLTTANSCNRNAGSEFADNPPLILADGRTASLGPALLFKAANMATSKLQNHTKERLLVLLNGWKMQENVRPSWLVNPITKARLELDLFLPELNIAIEVQGIQHTEYTPHFHTSEEDFEQQKFRDDVKKAVCEKRGILLYEVFCEADIETFIENVATHNPDLSFELYKKFCAMQTIGYYAARLHMVARKQPKLKNAVEAYSKRIYHILEKYNIPVESVKPDFSITKEQMQFLGKHLVKIQHYAISGKLLHTRQAALFGLKDGKVHTRHYYGSTNNGIDDHFFYLDTGYEIESKDPFTIWVLDKSTLPENFTERWVASEDILIED